MSNFHEDNFVHKNYRASDGSTIFGRDSNMYEFNGTPNEVTLRLIKNLEETIGHLRNSLQEKDEQLTYLMVTLKEKEESISDLRLIIKRGFIDVIARLDKRITTF